MRRGIGLRLEGGLVVVVWVYSFVLFISIAFFIARIAVGVWGVWHGYFFFCYHLSFIVHHFASIPPIYKLSYIPYLFVVLFMLSFLGRGCCRKQCLYIKAQVNMFQGGSSKSWGKFGGGLVRGSPLHIG